MPAGRAWNEAERAMWDELWASPQATQWHDAYVPLVSMYVQIVCQSLRGNATAGLAQEARHLAEQLGLSPAGLRTLGWQMEPVNISTGELHALPGGAA
ncbi:hypothetical protein [Streptomyces hilarionis]|uniref:hypothetical protein n=1 Tax=Streptomyces hilarionis TaxID=2839954 RepID=UPI00211A0D1E|nr:hypothetical protein [Streptomyces hilarionis]